MLGSALNCTVWLPRCCASSWMSILRIRPKSIQLQPSLQLLARNPCFNEPFRRWTLYCCRLSQVLLLSLCVRVVAKWCINWEAILLKNTNVKFSIGFRNLQRLKYSDATKCSDTLLKYHWLVMNILSETWLSCEQPVLRDCDTGVYLILAVFNRPLPKRNLFKCYNGLVVKKSPVFIAPARLIRHS